MSSSIAQRWIKRALAVLAVCQVGALTLGNAPISILGSSVGDRHTISARSSEPSKNDSTAGSGDVSATTPPPPGSETTSTADGDSPPDITPNIVGTLGNNQWYVSDVHLTWTVADTETPDVTTDGCDGSDVVADTTGETFTCKATSAGGSRTTTVKIGRDATAPTDLSVTTDIAPAVTGWFTSPFTATWHGTDATSDISTCTEGPQYSGPDTGEGTLTGTCTDNAGNAAAAFPFTFKFDSNAPDVVGTPDRLADHNDWYNHDVTITWTSSDTSATCDAPAVHSTGDSATASESGSCTDAAGLVGTGTFGFRYDETAPTISLTTPADGAIYILHQPVNADYACEDVTSGIDTCVGTTGSGSAIDTSTVGSKGFTVDAADQAGNAAVSVANTYSVRYQAAGVQCGGVIGHEILEPITKRSTFKQGSTVPAKFRVCDFFGTPITTNGVVQGFTMREGVSGSEQPVKSTSAHDEYRAGDSQWIFNIDTKPMSKSEYAFRIALDDGTNVDFGFTLR